MRGGTNTFFSVRGVFVLQAHRAAGEERRRRLAISLATLSKKPEKRANVVANGGVAALTKLSRSEESRTRSSCAEVLLLSWICVAAQNLISCFLSSCVCTRYYVVSVGQHCQHVHTGCCGSWPKEEPGTDVLSQKYGRKLKAHDLHRGENATASHCCIACE